MQGQPIPFKRTDDRAIVPMREHTYDAGMDLYALEDMVIRPGEVVRIRTGIHLSLKENEVCLFWGKSGRAWNVKEDRPVGLVVLGGCIDGPYRGELFVTLGNINLSSTFALLNATISMVAGHDKSFIGLNDYQRTVAQDTVQIPYGKACVQFLIVNGLRFPTLIEMPPAEWDLFHSDTERGVKGFGSSYGDFDEVTINQGEFAGTRFMATVNPIIYYKGQPFRQIDKTRQYEPMTVEAVQEYWEKIANPSRVLPDETLKEHEERIQGLYPMPWKILVANYSGHDLHLAKTWCIKQGIDPNGEMTEEQINDFQYFMYEKAIAALKDMGVAVVNDKGKPTPEAQKAYRDYVGECEEEIEADEKIADDAAEAYQRRPYNPVHPHPRDLDAEYNPEE